MKRLHTFQALLISSIVLFGITSADAFDDLPFPSRRATQSTESPKLDETSVQKAVTAQMRARFEAAAGPSSHVLTAEAAKTAGWGFVSDHFTEIDNNKDGYVSLSDVLHFTATRSPQRLMSIQKSRKTKLQVIE